MGCGVVEITYSYGAANNNNKKLTIWSHWSALSLQFCIKYYFDIVSVANLLNQPQV